MKNLKKRKEKLMNSFVLKLHFLEDKTLKNEDNECLDTS